MSKRLTADVAKLRQEMDATIEKVEALAARVAALPSPKPKPKARTKPKAKKANAASR